MIIGTHIPPIPLESDIDFKNDMIMEYMKISQILIIWEHYVLEINGGIYGVSLVQCTCACAQDI